MDQTDPPAPAAAQRGSCAVGASCDGASRIARAWQVRARSLSLAGAPTPARPQRPEPARVRAIRRPRTH
jgi:hypothetical protein